MELKYSRLIFFFLSLYQILTSTKTDSTCATDNGLIIKNVDLYQSLNVYEFARLGYKANRSLYGVSVDYNNLNFYPNLNSWRQALDNRSLTDIAFSSLELPFNDVETEKYRDMVMVPTMLGALAIIYNIPNMSVNLNLTITTTAAIYLGKIVRWNDESLQLLNPGIQLPNQSIVVTANKLDYYFTDSFFLTNIIGAVSSEFKNTYGLVIDSWPNNANVTFLSSPTLNSPQLVNMTPYSIGYSSISVLNILQLTKLQQAKMANPFTGTNSPIIESVQSTANTLFTENGSQMTKLKLDVMMFIKMSYPFVYIHYEVINRTTSPNVSCCMMQETLGFLEFFLDSALKDPSSLTKYGYYPLPKNIADYVKTSMLTAFTCGGINSISELHKSFIFSSSIQAESTRNSLIIGVSLVSLLILVVSGFTFYTKRIQLAKEKFWYIEKEELLIQDDKLKPFSSSVYSMSTVQSQRSANEMMKKNELYKMLKKYHLIRTHWTRTETDVLMKLLPMKEVSTWNMKTKVLIGILVKDTNHPNLCAIHGISILDSRPHLISQLCSKGSLNYVLSTSAYHLSSDIKYSLAGDVLSGLQYLHQKNIIHGSLSSITCYVDNVWNVKLFDWATCSILSSEHVKPSEIQTDTLVDEEYLIKLLYMDPNTLSLSQPSFSGDLYSYGMLLVEIFTRKLPFDEEVQLCSSTYLEIIKNKFNKVHSIPEMSKSDVPLEVQILVQKTTGPPHLRPDVNSMARSLQAIRGTSNKSIVDIMMETMESYVDDLEEKVVERTSELTEVTNQMRDLLYELLPPQIAMKFIKREQIEPEFYECVTICFSDIVGFTTISARSTPFQVMNFLNELWNVFDRTMEKFDVYKVDTIGDAYMVASGLPKRNGIAHCKEIAELALALIGESQNFFIPHLPDEKVLIRMGINSGPVTAGVVGRKMPQYCIFGDTVNTASRMESTSLPLKIQVSEYASKLVLQYYPEYNFIYRGDTEIKGKGTMKTFWLVSSEDCET